MGCPHHAHNTLRPAPGGCAGCLLYRRWWALLQGPSPPPGADSLSLSLCPALPQGTSYTQGPCWPLVGVGTPRTRPIRFSHHKGLLPHKATTPASSAHAPVDCGTGLWQLAGGGRAAPPRHTQLQPSSMVSLLYNTGQDTGQLPSSWLGPLPACTICVCACAVGLGPAFKSFQMHSSVHTRGTEVNRCLQSWTTHPFRSVHHQATGQAGCSKEGGGQGSGGVLDQQRGRVAPQPGDTRRGDAGAGE